MVNKKSKQDLMQEVRSATDSELSYMLGRYCGPHNTLIREKNYSYEACKSIQRIIYDELAVRAFDNIFHSDT